jgi:hypothetical protein
MKRQKGVFPSLTPKHKLLIWPYGSGGLEERPMMDFGRGK